MSEAVFLDLDFDQQPLLDPSGDSTRFNKRWHLMGAGLSNVWRYGELALPAPSGRLLLRGPNGTGKTTALEALWPFLLDLNAIRLGAGKARQTTLKGLMAEGASSKRRYGYVWLTFEAPLPEEADTEAPDPEVVTSFGVRLQYSASASPSVRVIPFSVPGSLPGSVALHGERGAALELEEFTAAVEGVGGTVFSDDDEYVESLAARVWHTTGADLRLLAGRLREVRNPSLLGEVSPQGAANALRASLPGVSADVLSATAEALAESETTRSAFEQDQRNAAVLDDFAHAWTGHVAEVVTGAVAASTSAAETVEAKSRQVRSLTAAEERARLDAEAKQGQLTSLESRSNQLAGEITAIERSEAYKAAGSLSELEGRLSAETQAADAHLQRLAEAASSARRRSDTNFEQLGQIRSDLAAVSGEAATADSGAFALEANVDLTRRPRAVHAVGDRSIDPGPGVTVHVDLAALTSAAGEWNAGADKNEAEAGRAGLLIKEHQNVAEAYGRWERAERKAEQADDARYQAEQTALRHAVVADNAAEAALSETRQWADKHPRLRGAQPSDASDEGDIGFWDEESVAEVTGSEPALILQQLDTWAAHAVAVAERDAAAKESEARSAEATADDLDRHAAEMRQRATDLRSGELLPLPRPDWAGPGDDNQALGATLEWREDVTTDAERALLEVALAASGLLGATLTAAAASTEAWIVEAGGEPVGGHLGEVLAVDEAHPLSAQALAVLKRIALRPGAPADHSGPAALVIGRDGSYRAGVVVGRPLQALESGTAVPAASLVGARQRRQAALAEAERLDRLADETEAEASRSRRTASSLREAAAEVRRAAKSFPDRGELRRAESARANAAAQASELADVAHAARQAEQAAKAEHQAAHREWAKHANDFGLPADVHELRERQAAAQNAAAVLRRAASRLTAALIPRLQQALGGLDDEEELAGALSRLASSASEAHAQAERTGVTLNSLRRRSGESIDKAVADHARLSAELREVKQAIGPANTAHISAVKAHTEQVTRLEEAEKALAGARPAQAAAVAHLRRMLSVPAVAEALGLPDPLPSDENLTALAADVVKGRRTHNRKFVGERYDQARADLAGVWTVARADAGEGLEELDVYILTHAEAEYSPVAAAAHGLKLKQRAEESLAAAEQMALNEFVIGRLPSAIGQAWVRLEDWKRQVNRKMRSAEASSGVGVQVEINLSPELPEAVRTVFELSCKVSDADRTDSQRAAVGRALQSLINAAQGENMLDRLTEAVDIRNWVDVHYQVTRPGGKPTRWGPRTGLSGGERRLVVLAPMLAAVAAAYDRFGAEGLRLVPLDEVPAEVDERGREGLARYIAELDLDLVCTSYLWDGAPGAWDGVDAYDLEAAPDGTVVGFPMLVRGAADFPGDQGVAILQ